MAEVVLLVKIIGGEGPKGKVKGRCALGLAVKMSMGTVVAEEMAATAAVSSWLLHELNRRED